jgi:hypothetical protein
MSNEETNTEETGLAIFGGAGDIAAKLQESAADAAEIDKLAEGQVDLLKLGKFGSDNGKGYTPWTYGMDRTPVHENSVWVIDPTTFRHGYQAYPKDPDDTQKLLKKAPKEVFVTWFEKKPPQPETVREYDDELGKELVYEFKDAYSMNLVCESSPDENNVGAYVRLSDAKKLGLQTYAKIHQAFRQRALAGQDGKPELLKNFYPRVRLSHSEPYLKQFSSKYNKPEMEILHWGTAGVVAEVAEPQADPGDDGEAPKRPARRRG